MDQCVLTWRRAQVKVRDRMIGSVEVNMVNYLPSSNWSSNMFFHFERVQAYELAIRNGTPCDMSQRYLDQWISISINTIL